MKGETERDNFAVGCPFLQTNNETNKIKKNKNASDVFLLLSLRSLALNRGATCTVFCSTPLAPDLVQYLPTQSLPSDGVLHEIIERAKNASTKGKKEVKVTRCVFWSCSSRLFWTPSSFPQRFPPQDCQISSLFLFRGWCHGR